MGWSVKKWMAKYIQLLIEKKNIKSQILILCSKFECLLFVLMFFFILELKSHDEKNMETGEEWTSRISHARCDHKYPGLHIVITSGICKLQVHLNLKIFIFADRSMYETFLCSLQVAQSVSSWVLSSIQLLRKTLLCSIQ